jgi:tetratricopeptide (TPR) repeat protein
VAGTTKNPVLKLQALGQAMAAAEGATSTSEEPFNAWYNLSAFYAARNDFGGTERCLREAIAARPNWFKPHWTLAQVLRLEGRAGEAEAEAAIAVDRDGGKHPEVARTLADIRNRRVGQPW